MNQIADSLKGAKTYLLAFAALLYGVSGYILGYIDVNTAIHIVWLAATVAALRAGIKNSVLDTINFVIQTLNSEPSPVPPVVEPVPVSPAVTLTITPEQLQQLQQSNVLQLQVSSPSQT